ncbi:MAG: hypothetical protein JW839_02105 [Candidatus Lokiarchaeota archaeon]|nr:hypothetical protein [Candidatus Lokiarchaeota archaeon]
MSAESAAALGLAVDKSRKFTTGAGRCDKCGFYKTWQFKIENPKTGKGLPGHVTVDGHKIGDGQCPFYLLGEDAKAKLPVESPKGVEALVNLIETTYEHEVVSPGLPQRPQPVARPADPAQAGAAGYFQVILDVVEGYCAAVENNASLARFIIMANNAMVQIKKLALHGKKQATEAEGNAN